MRTYMKMREDGHRGLFAAEPGLAGQVVLDVLEGEKVEEPTQHSIEAIMDHYMHPEGQYTNHSCNPSAFVTNWGTLVLLRNVDTHDEITFDYLANESKITSPFDCTCGAENCRGRIE